MLLLQLIQVITCDNSKRNYVYYQIIEHITHTGRSDNT